MLRRNISMENRQSPLFDTTGSALCDLQHPAANRRNAAVSF
jgi:hypothetical protein